MDVTPSAALHFPGAQKLELDVLIDQLVERARDVQRSQGRLRALLRAIETMSSDPNLDATLHNVVTAACELADATYGALGVIGHDGGLEEFITVGMTPEAIADMGRPPQGHGLLGALIREPLPIRLKDIVGDERSAGFPPRHPAMSTFLGVPVRVHGTVFGNLYLTESRSGEFTAEDQELVGALALAAGTAISNARLLRESTVQQGWLTASVEIGAQLLADDGVDPLEVIAGRVIDLADADLAVVSLLSPDSLDLIVQASAGTGFPQLRGRRFAVHDSAVRAVVEGHGPLRVAAADRDFEVDGTAMTPLIGPFMALPLAGTQRVRGVLSLARTRGRRPFGEADLAMAVSFAGHASVALELADSRATRQQLVQAEDRDRIARNLHDHVIQELFAIGLGLETTARLAEPDGVVAQRIHQRVRDIDRTIRQIRTSIFELRGPLAGSGAGTRHRILQIVADLSEPLGFAPQVVFSGLIDTSVTAALVDDLLAATRELLTNIAKHAHATRADLEVTVSGTQLSLTVVDDGIGCTDTGRRSGLANLRVRAHQHGGSFDVSPSASGGTTVTWKATL